MGDLGLSSTFGVGAMQQSVRQRIAEQLMRQQQDFENQQKQNASDRADRSLSLQEQEHAAALAERQQQAAVGNAAKLAPDLPMDQNVSPMAAGILRTGGMGGQLYTPPTQGDTASGKPFDPTTANPAMNLGTPAQQEGARKMRLRGVLLADPTLTARDRLNLQAEDVGLKPLAPVPPGEVKETPNGFVRIGGDNSVTPITSGGKPVTAYHAPEKEPNPAPQFLTGADGQLHAYQVIGGALHEVPLPAGSAKPDAQSAASGRAKTEALDTLGQLDQAIEAAKDLIGPGEGRVSNVEQMVGSADPRIQALGVKMKAAKMRADHAITGSVRAGASPVLLQQWDNILANKVTPEGLKAGVQALREIIQGSGGAGAPAAGAVRTYNPATGKLD